MDVEEQVSTTVVTDPTKHTCECGQGNLTEYAKGEHPKTKTHKENMQAKGGVQLEVNGPWLSMPGDLQTAIDTCPDDPLLSAKMVRHAFASRNWPNRAHPGSVREFMQEYNITIFDVPGGANLKQADSDTVRTNQIKEYINGSH